MREVLVLGMGNRLMMDDGIGVYMVEELMRRNGNPFVRYIVCETDIEYCLDLLCNSTFIILIDAAIMEKKPGTMTVLPLYEAAIEAGLPVSAHDVHPLADKLSGHTGNKGLFIGIEPYRIECHIGISDILKAKFPILIKKAERTISGVL